MQEHLKENCPNEDDVWEFGDDLSEQDHVDHEKSLQWHHIGREYLWMLADIVEAAITNRRSDAASTGLRSLLSMASDAARLDNLGMKQKDEIVRWGYYHAGRLSVHCIDQGLNDRMLPLSPFCDISDMLREDRPYARFALAEFGQFLVEAALRNAVTTFVLNDIGAIARGAATRSKLSAINRAAVRFAVNVFDKIRGLFEENLTGRNWREYLECHSQIESVKKWLLQHNPEERELVEYCNIAQGRFAKLDRAREIVDRASVEWPDMKGPSLGNNDAESN